MWIEKARAAPTVEASPNERQSLTLRPGVQLFLDDYFIDEMQNLERRVQQPKRWEEPVLDSANFGTTQPYLSVIQDTDLDCFRLWYNRGAEVCHAESIDAIHWGKPRVVLKDQKFCCSVIDDGQQAADPQRRFKMANNNRTRPRKKGKPGDEGMWIWFSPDGLRWTPSDRNPALLNYPEGYPKLSRHGIGDIIDTFYDPLRKRYAVAMKLEALEEDGYARSRWQGNAFRRLVGMSTSKDFVHWEEPWRIFTPDEQDEGLLEFYGMGGMHVRGGLYIGFVRILRDDLPCDPGGPVEGIGYSVLATSRDGVTWQRFREPFLDRNHAGGTWDHAMAWMSSVVPVGDQFYLYYGGYARGHKVGRDTQRQIGLARMQRDRYVSLSATKDRQGILRTPQFLLPSDRLSVNADAANGKIEIRLISADAGSATASSFLAAPIVDNCLTRSVLWDRSPRELIGKPVMLEVRLQHASLFGVEWLNLQPDNEVRNG